SALPFVLAPMQRYTVTAPTGVKDLFGRKLNKPVSITFQTGHRAPHLSWLPNFVVLEKNAATSAPVTFTNLDWLDLFYHPLFAGNLGRNVSGNKAPPMKSLSLLALAKDKVKKDAVVTVPLGLRQALGGKSGIIWGKFSWFGNTGQPPQKGDKQKSK